jgi:hypothetical protein
MISKDSTMEFEEIDMLCLQIVKLAVKRDRLEVVRLLKKIVPEFISNNSEFEVLDSKGEEFIIP